MKVVHLAPYDGIGGVENAMRTMPTTLGDGLAFNRVYLTDETGRARTRALHNPIHLWNVAWRVARSKPDILIASLWRAVFVAIVVKILTPRTQLVTFLHCARTVHFADRIAHNLAVPLSTEVWADSNATRRTRLSANTLAKSRTISFKLRNVDPAGSDHDPVPRFIFWGRLHADKNLEQAIALFNVVRERCLVASFRIIGPDGGELDRLRALVAAHDLGDAVHFVGARDFDGLREEAAGASFYLQTSSVEGLAMSVVEAMQFALVPIVTPVGAIGDYCRDGENSIIVQGESETTVERIVQVLQNPTIYAAMRDRARQTWLKTPLYQDDISLACRTLINRSSEKQLSN